MIRSSVLLLRREGGAVGRSGGSQSLEREWKDEALQAKALELHITGDPTPKKKKKTDDPEPQEKKADKPDKPKQG